MGRGRPVGFTRRELLIGGLGAAASAGLAWRLYRPFPASRGRILGEIVGASHAPGHRLREGKFPEPSATESIGVAIVGGGVAGLSAAWRLAKRGRTDFRVFELEPREGGTSAWGANGTTRYPWGAHYLPVPGPDAVWVRELLEEMGACQWSDQGEPLWEERHLCSDPEERLFLDGEWRDGLFPAHGATADDLAQAARFREAMARYRSMRDAAGRRAFAIPVEASSRDEELIALDKMTMSAFLASLGITSKRVRWWVEYACRDDFGCSLETTSAWAGIHYWASRQEDGPLLTWPEGNGRLVRAMMERIGPRVETGRLAVRVVPEDRGAVVDLWDPRTDSVKRVKADHVVLAVPQFVAAKIVEPWREAPPEWLPSFTYSPWMVANVHVDRLPEGDGFETAWDNVIYDSEGLGYVVATHQLPRSAPGPSVLTYYRPFVGTDPAAERKRMLAMRWADWRDLVLADLSTAHAAIEEVVTRIDVMLWAHGMVRPTPGFLWGGRRALASHPVGRVHLAHSDLSGIALFEEAQYWGVRAAEGILG
ncbi:MAG: FAD-dependent oxidoreductase [Planctomycetota bacterium]|mgnify:CR=1 FL=1